MREIKFRAWDKTKKEMLYNIIAGGEYAYQVKTKNLCIKHFDELLWIGSNNLPVMQYTGLKDKNGVEIYEGDIYIRYSMRHGVLGKKKYEGVIEYNHSGFGYYMKDEAKDQFGEYYVKEKYWHYLRQTKDLEIIGNIYENPELLKERL